MAPSPVVDIKPKGPDKNTEKCVDGVSLNSKQSMSKNDYGSNSKEKTTVDSLGNINEKELKSLLDEAYSYKNPKDRLNKSPLFKNLLNEVEQDDISKKKRIDQNHSFIDGLTAPSFIQNEHNSVSNKDFRNILGCCEKEKKNKKSGKRDASNSNSSRRKFTHNLNINSGSQSSSVYNGNVGGANSFHSNSRSLSRSSQLARSQQPFSSRLANTKAAAVLTSSSNIDKPMVTTYNKQPIMTPALAPTTQQKTTELLMSSLSKSNDEIEMKILNAKNDDSVHNYTTHAVLEINGGGNSYGSTDVGANVGQHDLNGKCKPSTNDTLVEFSLPRSSGTLVNGIEGTSSVESAVTSDTVNGLFINAEDVENANAINEYDEEKQLKKKNKKKMVSSVSSADGVVDGTSSVDESKTRSSMPEKDEQNMAWVTNPTLHSYSLTWNNVTLPSLYLFGDPTGRSIYSKESESKKLNNDSCTLTKDGAASGFKDRTDDRKHKGRKTKQQKPDIASYKSESIAGHCGDKSISYLLEYIENDHSNGGGTVGSVGQKSTKSKTASSNMASKHEKQLKGKACTDEDIRNKKPSKAKERLKKSSSLEDLRHNKAKSNKKQSSVDESHYTKTEDEENENAAEDDHTTAAANRVQITPNITAASHVIASVTETEFHMPVDEETRLCLDSLINDDNYTETEFRLVTKKQRRKKLSKSTSRTTDQKVVGESSSLSHGFLPHPYSDRNEGGGFKRSTRGNENRHRSRRKSVSSVVPSEKISDSDSIHSLPVSSTTPKYKIKKKSTSSGCTPQASYADIAKSPQCQSSMALSGEPISAVAADKWQVKSFSNASASSNTRDLAATSVSLNPTSSCSTAVLSEHSDNSELVSSTTCGNHVELDDGCDQLLLTSSNNDISNNSAGSGSPSSVNNIDEGKITTNNSNNNSSVNRNNDNDVNSSDVTRIDVTLRRKSKTNNKSNSNENGDDNNNNSNYTCCSAKSEKSMSSLNSSTITNGTKVKKSKNRKKTQGDELDVVTNCRNMSSNNVCSKQDNDLFVEFTLKCTPPAVVTTKCSETQTDLVEVNNNAFCNDVTVEETVILKSSRGSLDSGNIGIRNTETKGEKFSKTSLPIDETGSRIVVLPHDGGSENVVSVGFDVNTQLLEDAVVVQEKRTAMLKEVRERSSKYNVSEVIQYVHKSWNEVMDTLSSTKITDATRIQYYVAK